MRRLHVLSRALRPPYRRTSRVSTSAEHRASRTVPRSGDREGLSGRTPVNSIIETRPSHSGAPPRRRDTAPTSLPGAEPDAPDRVALGQGATTGGAAHHRAPASVDEGVRCQDVACAVLMDVFPPRKRHSSGRSPRRWRRSVSLAQNIGGNPSLSRGRGAWGGCGARPRSVLTPPPGTAPGARSAHRRARRATPRTPPGRPARLRWSHGRRSTGVPGAPRRHRSRSPGPRRP